ncbi:hypothetical protein GOARA_068_00460 [Gordonia araii NBRC 100433]|uniref:DUF6194 domain-containing protein n=1 Tax=Gordonia araii NBRC 100433 TaxID=1073574 RepID=G7H6B2_9ACTN|nr:DUF6194 family protein [Gordonia araii]NNG96068.1 hypothetical protein [Gordonia araii NBRC 100433]GAB11387.1 hypothetical protein GOARA_068_00460 [Gordonia araii NBRC 100433]
MSMNEILATIRDFPGVLELAPMPGSDHPELSWGDHFFYWAPDGAVPRNRQPYATIVTKDYPGDDASRLDDPGRWRLNVHVGSKRFAELVGHTPRESDAESVDFAATDTFFPHPVYGAAGWVAVVNPGPRTTARALAVLREAHDADRCRTERRSTDRRPRPGD